MGTDLQARWRTRYSSQGAKAIIRDGLQRAVHHPKKVSNVLKGGRRFEKIRFIKDHQQDHSITLMCEVLDISRATYYKYRTHLDDDYPEYQMIKELFLRHKKTLGYRRMTSVIRDTHGIVMNHKKVRRIMNKYGLRATYIKKLRPNYKKQYYSRVVQTDHLQRNFNQRGWVTDITYLMINVNGKRAYLSTILDLETRDWVAYKIHYRNDIELVVSTLQQALESSKEKDLNGLTLHSDQGSQYLSTEYQQICVSNGIRVSHARKANPLDNAVIESFHAILKKETLYHHPITSLDQYISIVHEWMTYYNTIRPRNQKK